MDKMLVDRLARMLVVDWAKNQQSLRQNAIR